MSTRTEPFEVLPAIDLRGGSVVRLTRGRFDRETGYGSDPVAVARRFAAAGARWLHVVDLDGARAGRPVQLDAVRAVVAGVGPAVAVELGGGLRTLEAVEGAVAAGVARIALGTRAIDDPAFVGRVVARLGADRVMAAIDVRDGLAVGEGWRDGAPGADPQALVLALADLGIERVAVTAIERDGTLAGPDVDLLGRIVALGAGAVVASGGIASLADIEAVRTAGCAGAIVGRALYEGRLDPAAAIAMGS